VFPSEYEKKRRHRSDQNISADELNHYVFMTKDCLKIGMKLLVAYRIKDSHKALSQLGGNNIVNTIENLVSVKPRFCASAFSASENVPIFDFAPFAPFAP